ncbi:hypothetical protein [Streptomyces sp. NPDC051994]|uniref:hypothetical protein n=1 Tax=unclassified Streptomyces TaxID=2593676 RepID=UPI003426BC3F
MQLGRKWPGSAPGHEWKQADDVVEVDDQLGLELLAIPNGGFYEVTPKPEAGDEPEPEPDTAPDSEDTPEQPKRRPGRPRKSPPEAEVSE